MASQQHDFGSDSEETTLYFRASRNLFEKLEVSTAKIHVQAEAEAQALGLRPRIGLRVKPDDGGSSSLASSYNDSDKDKTIQPSNLTDDSSETCVHRLEARCAKQKMILTSKKQKKTQLYQVSVFFIIILIMLY